MNNPHKKAILILAAGHGSRMAADVPKQFLALEGKPLLVHTIENIYEADPDLAVYIVIQKDFEKEMRALLNTNFPNQNIGILYGGKERFDSTKKALEQLDDYEYILIHDAARPFVTQKMIQEGLALLETEKVVIPVVAVVDSIRQLEGGESKMLNRSQLRAVQTPQFFNGVALKTVFSQTEFKESFSDDASVMENAGYKVAFVDGHIYNIKLTHPLDFEMASLILKHRKA